MSHADSGQIFSRTHPYTVILSEAKNLGSFSESTLAETNQRRFGSCRYKVEGLT